MADGTASWRSADEYVYWSHTHLTLDVATDQGGGLSLGTPERIRFLLRSRLLTNDEWSTSRCNRPPTLTTPERVVVGG